MPKKSWASRFARLWPLHLATLTIWLIATPSTGWFAPGTEGYEPLIAVTNVLLLQAWIPLFAVYFSFNSVSWSISTELFFYLAFPWLRKNLSRTWHWKTALVFLMVASIVVVGTNAGVPAYRGDFTEVNRDGLAYLSPFVRIYQFLFGMLAAQVYFAMPSMAGRLPRWVWAALEVGLLASIGWVSTFGVWVSGALYGDAGSLAAMVTRDVFMALLFACIMVVFGVGRGPLSKALSARPLVLLGEASFALYLVHQIMLSVLQRNHAAWVGDLPPPLVFAVFLVAALAASLLLFFGVEKPCRRFIVTRFAGRRPAPPVQPPEPGTQRA